MTHRRLAILLVLAASAALPAQWARSEPAGTSIDLSPIPANPPLPQGPPQTISGRCLVVTDGGREITLAEVEVRIYPEREFDWYVRQIEGRSQEHFEAMKPIACPENFAALSVPEMDRSLAAADVLQHNLHIVWEVMPAAEVSTHTDAAGRFSITHEVAPPYIVFAICSRTFAGETEYYRWQVPSRAIKNPLQVELGNARLR